MKDINIKYCLIIGLLFSFALLPLKALYLLSDIIRLFLHKILKYRLKIVRNNLRNSFPGKSEKELKAIEDEFYKHLCDTIVETIKLLHISDRQLKERVIVTNPELIHEISRAGNPIVLFMGHYCNWEWVPTLTLSVKEPQILGAIYRPLHNKVMDKVMLRIRSRFKSICIPKSNAYRTMVNWKRDGLSFMVGFIADQRPVGQPLSHWLCFLNQATPVVVGGDIIGEKVNAKFVYLRMDKVKRGYYTITFEEIKKEDDYKGKYPYTEAFYKMLGKSIHNAPAYWLWSHNRWKDSAKNSSENLKSV